MSSAALGGGNFSFGGSRCFRVALRQFGPCWVILRGNDFIACFFRSCFCELVVMLLVLFKPYYFVSGFVCL